MIRTKPNAKVLYSYMIVEHVIKAKTTIAENVMQTSPCVDDTTYNVKAIT
jgi:hypothetical protein